MHDYVFMYMCIDISVSIYICMYTYNLILTVPIYPALCETAVRSEQLPTAALNWAKRMITDTCAARIKQCLRRGGIIGADGNGKCYTSTSCSPLGVMMFHPAH